MRRNTHKPWPDGGEVFDATIEVPVTIRDLSRETNYRTEFVAVLNNQPHNTGPFDAV